MWNAEEIDDEDVNLGLAMGNYGQSGHYDDGAYQLCLDSNVCPIFSAAAHITQPQIGEATLMAVQQHMAQQAAFAQIPDVVKGVSGLLHLISFSNFLCSSLCGFTKQS